jgi:oxygen-independent coproporphyrinogen-3 oxidase
VHSAARAAEAVRVARAEGCGNLSLDLMLWLPGQSMASWLATVARAVELAPDHLSMYLLELYPNAPLREAMARATAGAGAIARPASEWIQAADDEAADMYLAGLEATDAAGFEQYEISNVARPLQKSSRHNLKYWQSGDWRGFGAGAHSTIDGVRWRNVNGTEDYIGRVNRGDPVALEVATLSPAERIEEALFTGLRLAAGVQRSGFQERFGVDPWVRHAETLVGYVDEGLMWARGGAFGLTRRGMLVANPVLAAFV